ncbi:MAG: 7-cyano-7-deazaguanine synthase QueC [Candidatus Omnitrophota bacterium]
MKRGVILLSGGIDSAVTLYYAKNKGYKLSALIFDYSQRHKNEIKRAVQIAKLNRIGCRVLKIDLSWAKSSLTNEKIKVPVDRKLRSREIPVTYVSGRNIIFLSYAFSLAESIEAKAVFIGAHTQDYSGYPDCRPEFLKSFAKAVNLGIKDKGMKLITPLINKNKKDIIKLGLKLGVPFQHTWSCYNGGAKPCKKCDSCKFRIKAFKELGINELQTTNYKLQFME